jgi:competence protein ComEC
MKRIWSYRFRRTTLLLMLFVGVLLGLGGAHTGYGLQGSWCCVAGFCMTLAWRRHDWLALLLVLCFGLCCGWWRGAIYMQRLGVYDELYYQKTTITARAMNDAIYGKNGQLSFDADHIVLTDGRELTGKIQLSGFGVNAVFQGDEVEAAGSLYPNLGSYQGRMSFAMVRVMAHHPSVMEVIRQRFTAGMQTALPEPLAPFSMGLLVGQRATLPDNVKNDLTHVGLTHIIAVSGYNLTIILHASRRLLGGQSKRMATFLSLALIGAFLLLTGASASIVRAAIVSVLSIAAAYYGREFKPLNLICLAAAVTAWANPVYVWSDISWYLSFLAFYGVLVLSPLVQKRWSGGWHQSLLGGVALESICASAMTEPFILHVFGQMSLISLPANVLVVALIPLAMLLGMIAGLAGMFASSVAGWFAWPAAGLLNYMLDTAHILAGLPHVFIQNRALSLAGMLGLYGVVCGVTVMLHHKTKSLKTAIITDRKPSILKGAMT